MAENGEDTTNTAADETPTDTTDLKTEEAGDTSATPAVTEPDAVKQKEEPQKEPDEPAKEPEEPPKEPEEPTKEPEDPPKEPEEPSKDQVEDTPPAQTEPKDAEPETTAPPAEATSPEAAEGGAADEVPSKPETQEPVKEAATEDPPKAPATEDSTPAATEVKNESEVAGATPAENKKDEGATGDDAKKVEGATANAEPPVKQKPKTLELELPPTLKEGDCCVVFVSRFTSGLLGKKSVRGFGAFSDQSFRFYLKTADYTSTRGKPSFIVPFTALEAVTRRADDTPTKPVPWPQNAVEAASVILRIGGKLNYFFFEDEESANKYIEFLITKQKELYVAPEPKKKRGASVKKESTPKKPSEGAATEEAPKAAADAPAAEDKTDASKEQASADATKDQAPAEAPSADATKDQASADATSAEAPKDQASADATKDSADTAAVTN